LDRKIVKSEYFKLLQNDDEKKVKVEGKNNAQLGCHPNHDDEKKVKMEGKNDQIGGHPNLNNDNQFIKSVSRSKPVYVPNESGILDQIDAMASSISRPNTIASSFRNYVEYMVKKSILMAKLRLMPGSDQIITGEDVLFAIKHSNPPKIQTHANLFRRYAYKRKFFQDENEMKPGDILLTNYFSIAPYKKRRKSMFVESSVTPVFVESDEDEEMDRCISVAKTRRSGNLKRKADDLGAVTWSVIERSDRASEMVLADSGSG
jgi:hypothetical protein